MSKTPRAPVPIRLRPSTTSPPSASFQQATAQPKPKPQIPIQPSPFILVTIFDCAKFQGQAAPAHPQIRQLRRVIIRQTSLSDQATPHSTTARASITATQIRRTRNTNRKRSPSLATRNATTTVKRPNVLQQTPQIHPLLPILIIKIPHPRIFRDPRHGSPCKSVKYAA